MSDTKQSEPRLRLRLTAAAQKAVRAGHPWVYSGSVLEQNRVGRAGELAVIYGKDNEFLAIGFFDPLSPIAVRILHRGKPRTIDRNFWLERLDAALEKRRGLFDSATTGYRLINGESDGWPGLVLDRYDDTLVAKLYATAWLSRLAEIAEVFKDRIPFDRLIFRLSRNILTAGMEQGLLPGQVFQGMPLTEPVLFRESGLAFEADVLNGQKTGFFLDQRENRRRVEQLSVGRKVLNAFSFNGGFSVYAARGGAVSVASLDISEHALNGAFRTFSLNQQLPSVAQCQHGVIKANAFEWLREGGGKNFDLIILDPPSLAKREAERERAIVAYLELARNAITHLAPGGILLACSCSAHVSAEEFYSAIHRAAQISKRSVKELERRGHAPDHPATFKEAEYLKAIYLSFEG